MTTPPRTAAALLARAVASDPGRPRVTVYDDTDSPTRGERVELSARVLANWVAKAANLLQDDLDAGPGTLVVLDLPPHWRTLYWALAAWSVGATVEVPAERARGATGRQGGTAGAAHSDADAAADVLVTDDPAVAGGAGTENVVLVTLAALARSAPAPLPGRVVDEARELSTHGDVFDPWDEPPPGATALTSPGERTAYEDLVPSTGTGGRVHTTTTDTSAFLHTALAAWAGDGSVVLTRGTPDPEVLAARLASEGVTATA